MVLMHAFQLFNSFSIFVIAIGTTDNSKYKMPLSGFKLQTSGTNAIKLFLP